jgi:hypothetical protein
MRGGAKQMVISSIQELLTNERAMRSGATSQHREDATAYVIDAAFNHPDPAIRKHAAGHLLSRGIEINYAQPAAG